MFGLPQSLDPFNNTSAPYIQQLHDMSDDIDAAFWSFDVHTGLLTVSASFMAMFGYSSEQFYRTPGLWNEIVHRQDIPLVLEHAEKMFTGRSTAAEFRLVHPTGEIRRVRWTGTSISDDETRVTRLHGAVFDMTGKRPEQEQPTNDILQVVKWNGQALVDDEAKYRFIAENMTDMVRIVDARGITVYASPSHHKLVGYSPEQYIEEQIFLQLVHPDDAEYVVGEFAEMVASKQARCVQFRITHADGRLVDLEEYGTPVVGEHGEVDYVVILSRDATDKKLAERALAESEANYRLMAENMTDIIGVINPSGTIRYASKKGLGYDAESMLGTSGLAYIHAEDVDYVQKEISDAVIAKTNKLLQFRFVHAEGFPVYVDCMITPVIGDDGKVESIITVSRDITDRVRMESALRESEERYFRLIEHSPQPMAAHRNRRFIHVNPAGLELLGARDMNEIIGKNIFDIVHPEYLEIAQKRVELLPETNYAGAREYKIVRIDGQVIEAEVMGIYDNKTESTLNVFRDITERKNMERALQESEARNRRLVELAPVAIVVYHNDKFTFVNPAAIKVLGAKRAEDIIGTHPLDWVHPDHREQTRRRIEHTFRYGYAPPGEYKVCRLDGKIVDVSVTSIYDPRSSSVQLVFEDITARKQAERALLDSEEMNRRLVELTPQAIALHSDFEYLYVNPATLALLGASQESDLIGRSTFDLIHPDYRERAAARIAGVYEHLSTSATVEQKIMRLDGTVIDVEVVTTSIPYKGKIAGMTLFRDITQRKLAEDDRQRAEKLIRDSEERYFRLQTSLDRFSHDLFGMMKVSEMERRLVKEVVDVIKSTKVYLLEADRNELMSVRSGNPGISAQLLRSLAAINLKHVPLCEIIELAEGYFLKIGESRGKSYLLCIGGKPPALRVTPKCVWLKTITRYVSVLYDSFRLIEDLTHELERIASHQVAPSWLLRLLFNLSENERKHLAQDLHDAALQEQIIWYRKLEHLSTDGSLSPELRQDIQQVTQGLLDVIYQIRITCNELRPPLVKEEGLVSSLEALFEFTQMRTNYSIEFDSDAFDHALNDDQLLGLYRIVQELLANATKHSKATRIKISLSGQPDRIQLSYEDNGIGMDVNGIENSFSRMGVYGMKERVRSMDGQMEMHSSPDEGLAVFISIPAVSTSLSL